jgi:hypothetical protein
MQLIDGKKISLQIQDEIAAVGNVRTEGIGLFFSHEFH